MNQKHLYLVLGLCASLLLLTVPLSYQAVSGLTNIFNLELPQLLLLAIAFIIGIFTAISIYDLFGYGHDLILLRDSFVNGIKETIQRIRLYFLFCKHQQLIKPYLQKKVMEYKQTPNLLKENWKYHCFEEVLLEHGVIMFPEININKHLNQKDNLVYVEGYTIFRENNSFPSIFSHAWMASSNHKKALDVLNKNPGVCYFGIPFSRQWIDNLLQARKKRGDKETLVFDIRTPEGLYILKYGLPENAIANKKD